MIQLTRVTYTYPHAKAPALRDLTLEIEAGSVVAIVGANGAGKSTLCAALAGFVPQHFRGELQGRIVVDGMDTTTTPLAELATRVGLVFQNPLTQLSGARLTVAAEVAFGLENLGVPRAEMAPRVQVALALVGLTDFAARSPYTLSGGELQRLAIAAMLVMEPRVLALDEPIAKLDPLGAKEIFSVIHSLATTRHCAIIIAAHNVEWIATFAQRVIVLHEGAMVCDGSPRTVLSDARLAAWGVNAPRYTTAAQRARELGWWLSTTPLPVTLAEATRSFREQTLRKENTAEPLPA